MKELGLPEATPFIQEALGQLDWATEGKKWLKGLWTFFESVVPTRTSDVNMESFMDHLQDMAVLPIQGSKTDTYCHCPPSPGFF